ncbi:type I restriction endonuclease subunit R [Aquibacillus koreensis]|uniref:Type I restriction enzyme endonuclease subunit n=1 Tax=Aquibacillus koreensis TaxID=279446 RepID=A0A9X3WLL5_9BACI|nr:type I restriction endonuclease subunit R [Aquibacillus koreensis]MCT2534780.1 type I restriction endonuclease subunit R [Aquibacillus koreensis]MDC3419609.1 type I restriction endonuclease subunit R [Aquibacillus koreensis]
MNETQEWNEQGLVENRLVNHLKQLGYTYVHGSELDKERETQLEIVLKKQLIDSIKKLNPWINKNNLNKVVRSITHMEFTNVMEANQNFHELLINKMSVQQDLGTGRKNQTVQLIDFDNIDKNEFIVTNQLHITSAHGTIIPDVMVYVNGLPLVVIECKSPTLAPAEQIGQGVKQLRRYQKESELLFHYNQFVVATSNDRAKVGTIGANVQHYSAWKEPYPMTVKELGSHATAQEILIAGVLDKQRLFDIIQNFIVYEPEDGRVIKKMGRYQQYRAVNKAVERILSGTHPQARGGVVWATQGSGKSLSMVFLSMKLRRIKELKNPIIVVVTDRQDLETQITNTFRRCGFPNPQQAESVAELKELLQKGPGATVMTLVQKFQEGEGEKEYPVLTASENVVVLVDESHRSQYSSLAMNMRTALPNATYIGFTGTPIDKEDKSTVRTFGTYIDKYPIEKAVEDGATVPIFYEARMVDLHVQGESIDSLFDRFFRDYSDEDRERIKKKYATEEAITTSPKRIRTVVLDIIDHFEKHIKPNGFKAQIVAISREAAVNYKEVFDELSDYESKVIISGGHNDDDRMKRHHLSRPEEKEVIKRFKKPMEEDSLSFLIVCDKLLTGFDAPIEQVMYLDKPLKEHNLLQAIARTNRTYDKKSYGLIVDYYGVSRFLEEALGIFHEEDIKGALNHVDEEIPRLQTRHRKAIRFFDYKNKENLDANLAVLEPEDIRNEFDTAFKKFSESMDMIMPSPKARPYLDDLKWLGKIRKLAKSRYHIEDGMDISDCGGKVRELIEEYIYASTPEILFEPINILSNKFDEKLDEIKTPEAKAAEMEHAIKHEIRIKLEENPVKYTSLKERLEQLIEQRKARQMTIEELLEEYQAMREEMINMEKESESFGLDDTKQLPFYQLLEQELPDGYEGESIKDLTEIITDTIQELAVIDWIEKDDVKREMRRKIKKQLRVSEIPNKNVENVARQLMDLAKVHYMQIGY